MSTVKTAKGETAKTFVGMVDVFKDPKGKTGLYGCVPKRVASKMFMTLGRGFREVTCGRVAKFTAHASPPKEFGQMIKSNKRDRAIFEAHVSAALAEKMLAHAEQAGVPIHR